MQYGLMNEILAHIAFINCPNQTNINQRMYISLFSSFFG
jgi:hypothetical protein